LPPSTHVFSERFIQPSAQQVLNWVVVVDDRDDPVADQLRSDVKAAFSASLDSFLVGNDDPPTPRDTWLSVNTAVFVVHPSRSGDERWTGPADDPALRWQTPQADAKNARLFADAFARAVDQAPAPTGARYQSLEAYRDVVALKTNCVEPHGPRQTMIAEAPRGVTFAMIVSGTDDDSTEPAPVYVDAVNACGDDFFGAMVFVPVVPAQDGGRCAPRATDAWRLLALDKFLFDAFGTFCDGVDRLTHLFSSHFIFHYFGGSNCVARPLRLRDDGLAACTLRVVHAQPMGCPLSRGWFDLPTADGGSGATVINTPKGEHRVCEVRQLEGEAGANCRSGAPCPDCPSGFCMRTDDSMKWCRSGGFRADLHVTGGAALGPLEGHLTCTLEP